MVLGTFSKHTSDFHSLAEVFPDTEEPRLCISEVIEWESEAVLFVLRLMGYE